MKEIKLDPNKTALVVIDMQKGIAAMGRKLVPYDSGTVVTNVARLIQKFRERGAAVILVHVTSASGKDMLSPLVDEAPSWGAMPRQPDWADFIDEIKPQNSDIVITKRQWGAFYGTELDLQLRRRGIGTIVLCGIATNIGVETTAREAYQYGYNQVFAVDAMAASSKEEHDNTAKFIFPRIGLIRTTEQVMGML
jgi:nicotinamidase-related amidase